MLAYRSPAPNIPAVLLALFLLAPWPRRSRPSRRTPCRSPPPATPLPPQAIRDILEAPPSPWVLPSARPRSRC